VTGSRGTTEEGRDAKACRYLVTETRATYARGGWSMVVEERAYYNGSRGDPSDLTRRRFVWDLSWKGHGSREGVAKNNEKIGGVGEGEQEDAYPGNLVRSLSGLF